MNAKKIIKIIAALVAVVLLVGILLLANSLLGNPISQMLAARGAESYVAETYPDLELVLSKPTYSFKFGHYFVNAQSSTSIDTHFTLYFNAWGKLTYEDYEGRVAGLGNTRNRVAELYGEQVDAVIDVASFPYPGYIKFGELYDIPKEKLELDQEYDVMELGKEDGRLVLYIEDETVNVERAAEILLDIRALLDEAGICFARVDFSLIKPRIDDQPNPDDTEFSIGEFPYEDIYEEGFTQRLEAAAEELGAYYAEQDAIKDGESAQEK